MKNTISRLLAGSVLFALVLAGGCGKPQSGNSGGTTASGESGQPAPDSLIAKIDTHGDEIMASSSKAEARAWLKGPTHVFFKEDPKQVGEFVEAFYGAGASQVLIGDIEEHDGKQWAGALLIVLPKAADARAKIFEVGGKANDAFQEDPVADKGQKYLYYGFD
jgi:hypothetical protein